MTHMANIPRSHQWARRIAIVFTGIIVVMLAAWIRSDPRTRLETDWTAFDNAASRLLNGETVYVPYGETELLPYLYPPFVLLFALPLGLFGFYGSWVVAVLMTIVPFVVGVRLFARAEPAAPDRTTGVIVCIASGTLVSSALIGQYSGIYVLAIGGAALLWHKDRRILAGVVLAILLIKPNLAITVPVVLVWSRSWRTLAGFAGGGIGALALSLPFGLDKWEGFASNVSQMAELQRDGVVPSEKMVTMLGSAQTVFGLGSESPVVLGVWFATAAILGVCVLAVWTPQKLAESPVRAFGALAIFMIVANPRMYFYDGSVVVLGLFGLWMSSSTVGGALARRWIPPICLASWFFLWGGVFTTLNVFVGPLVFVALLVVAIDAHRSEAAILGISGTQTVHRVEETADAA
jgi:alpha-1,2-mannosyltransferase